jgi:exoribonuclease R
VGRSVILSCCKLAYGDVQSLIDAADTTSCTSTAPSWPPENKEVHGGHCWDDVAADALALHCLAKKLRRRRFDNGALRLDNVKLYFPEFDADDDGAPVRWEVHQQREANRLVEEFMLLANMTAARAVADAFPERLVSIGY